MEIADRSCSSDTVAELGQYSHPCRYQRMQYPNSIVPILQYPTHSIHTIPPSCIHMSTPILLDPLPLIIIWEPVEVSPQYSITLTAHIIQLWLGLSISREAQNQVQSEYDTSRSIWFSTRYINLQLVRLFIEHPNCFQWWGIPTVFAKPIAFVPESPVCAHGARVSRIWLIWTLLPGLIICIAR